jgi:hypothetical protein
MAFLCTFVLALGLFMQAGIVPSFEGDIFNSKEKEELEKANSVERRIKVYTNASKRIQKKLHEAVTKEKFQSVPRDLELWTMLLAKSLEDIETNLKPKKKSKNLIKYEIQVRKSLADLGDYKIRAPLDQQDVFDACIAKAKAIHKKFVEIIFPR